MTEKNDRSLLDPAEAAPDGEGTQKDPNSMGFLDHLEELRWTIGKSVLVFAIIFVVMAVFLKDVAHVLNWPLNRAFANAGERTGLVTTSPMAVFSVYLQVCFLGGLFGALPFVLFFIGRFVAPALNPREAKILLPACIASFVLFITGGAFAYFVLVPSAIKVSVFFNRLLDFELIWSADRYYGLLSWMVLGMGAAFQFPMVIQILVFLGIVEVAQLKKIRRIMIVVFFVISAIITPTPDPLTQSMVALPMIALYELSIQVAGRVAKARAAGLEADRAEGEAEGQG
jgi:sec-independent protein translocase protein TatC